ncbi:MAG: M56 family metallopeptidase, partial [Planctomycetaceae bacterium]|nr:M56 family metallopeptidase [Planctomycetaceae bacterium]
MNFASDFPPFWQLIWRATWQAGILACLICCVIFLLQRWISPKWRALLWTVPLIRLVLLIVPASGLSLFQFFSIEYNRVPQVADALMTVPAETVLRTSTSPGSHLPNFHSREQLLTTDRQGVNAPAKIPPESESKVGFSLSVLITCLWFLGFCVLLIRGIGSRWMLSRLIANSQPLQDTELLSFIAARQKQGFLKFPVRCVVTDAELGPSSCGFWHPTILLPRMLWEDFDQQSRRAIVSHELEHIRRHDALLQSLSRLALAMHWFNPLVYLITSQLRREIELAV